MVLQNDGDVTDDLVLTTPIVPQGQITVKVFVAYYDITALANGGGVVFHDVAPGASIVVAIQFRCDPGTTGLGTLAAVKLSSGFRARAG